MSFDGDWRHRPLPVRMRIVGVSKPWPGPAVYLAAFDVDANGGRGTVRITRRRQHAFVFAFRRRSARRLAPAEPVRPLRPDNRPNRPLTAYTVEIEAIWEQRR